MAKMTQIGKSIELAANSTANSDGSIPTTAFVQEAKLTPHPTIVATASTTRNNGVYNGGFEFAPAFVAVQTASNWIDGTAAGSATNDLYGWYLTVGANNSAARYDPTVSHNGGMSLKLSTTNTTGQVRVFNAVAATVPSLSKNAIVIKPSTKYRFSAWVKTYNVATSGAYIQIRQYDSAAVLGTATSTTALSGSNNWTYQEIVFTSDSDAVYFFIVLHNYVAGNVSDAWYDDIKLEEVIEDTGYTGSEPTPLISTIAGNTTLDNIDVFKTGGATSGAFSTNFWRAQQFVSTKSRITSVVLSLSKTGTPTGNLTVAIEGDNGSNYPNGTVYANNTIDVATLTTSEVSYTLTMPCVLTPGTLYWVTMKRPSADGATNYTNVYYGSGTYTHYIAASTTGSGWTTQYNTFEYDLTVNYAKSTECVSIVCNGEKISLCTNDAYGLNNGASIELEKGKYNWTIGNYAGQYDSPDILKLASCVVSATAGGAVTAPIYINGWNGNINGVFATTTASMIVKVNTMLPMKNLSITLRGYGDGTYNTAVYISTSQSAGTGANDWTLIEPTRLVNTPDTAFTTACAGHTTVFLKFVGSGGVTLIPGFTVEADLDTSSVPQPLVYPLATNQFSKKINIPLAANRIYYYSNMFENENGVVVPHLAFGYNAYIIGTYPLEIDNARETSPAVRILFTGTDPISAGDGTADSLGVILNNGEYAAITTGDYWLKVAYQIGAGTTTFSNITKNTIYVSSDGEYNNATYDPSLSFIFYYYYKLQSLVKTVQELTYKVNDINNRIPDGTWQTWTPTLAFGGGTPASITISKSRWMRVGKTIFIDLTFYSADSNGCTSCTITLPFPCRYVAGSNTSLSSYQRYGLTGTNYANPLAYIRTDTNNDKIQFAAFNACTDGQYIVMQVAGFYEID